MLLCLKRRITKRAFDEIAKFSVGNWHSGGSLVRPEVRVFWDQKSGLRPLRVPKILGTCNLVVILVDSSICFMVDSSIHFEFKVVPTKSIPL